MRLGGAEGSQDRSVMCAQRGGRDRHACSVTRHGRWASQLADLIEAAIATAVRSYTESRDYQARRQEAEHIGFVTHELRNPLTTATLAASQLQKDGALPTAQPQVLELLSKGLVRIKE